MDAHPPAELGRHLRDRVRAIASYSLGTMHHHGLSAQPNVYCQWGKEGRYIMEYMSVETFRLFDMLVMCGLVALFCLLFPLWIESVQAVRKGTPQPVTRYQAPGYLRTKVLHEHYINKRRVARIYRLRLVSSVAVA
jgi:hypothetical protein